MSKIVVYKITNIVNNKIYIGSTNNFTVRKQQHIWSLKNKKHRNCLLQRAWDRYGNENFVFEILEEIKNPEEILIREQFFLDLFKSYDRNIGYNINIIAGSNIGFKMPDSAKEKLRLINLGKKHSEETKRKISEVQKGKKRKFISKLLTSLKCRGEKNPAAKLNMDTVREIRSKKEEGISAKKLSIEYDVCITTIYNITSGKFWKEGEYYADKKAN